MSNPNAEPGSELDADSEALMACMAVQGCMRVCQRDGQQMWPAEADQGAFPYEFQCPTLDGSEVTVDVAFRDELKRAVTVPEIEFLGVEATGKEANAYLSFLQEDHKKFESYLETILKGGRMPRGAIAQAQEDWKTHRYESPAVDLEGLTADEKAEVSLFYAQLRGFHDRQTLKKHGILFDKNAQAVLEQAAQQLSVGHHITLSGDPGIAKSTLAKYVGMLNSKANAAKPGLKEKHHKPVMIKLSSTSEAESFLSRQTFVNGTLGSELGLVGEAMRDGRVVILDEQNAMTPDQQIFFNDLLLSKPGDIIQAGDKNIRILPGFAVIGTLNPLTDSQGNRRHGRQQQDAANAARFETIEIKYPGQAGYQGDPKETYTRLFYAQFVEQYGWQLPTGEVLNLIDNSQEFLKKLTVMATEPPADGTVAQAALRAAAAKPVLAECISPRDFARMLKKSMVHADIDDLPSEMRKAITAKARNITNSDNGQFVSPETVTAVELLLTQGGFATAV